MQRRGRPQVTLAQRNDLGQAFGLDRANESLRVGIQVGTASGKFERLDAGGSENSPERLREQRIPIMDQIAISVWEAVLAIREIARVC